MDKRTIDEREADSQRDSTESVKTGVDEVLDEIDERQDRAEAEQIIEEEAEDRADSPVKMIPPKTPQLVTKPGSKTFEGRITAVLGVVFLFTGMLGWTNPAKAHTWAETLAIFISNAWPAFAYLPVVWHFFTSHGKLKSNTAKANAEIACAFSSAQYDELLKRVEAAEEALKSRGVERRKQ